MNSNWQISYITRAQALCLRGVLCVPVADDVRSMGADKAFTQHAPGGSDG